jgi:hypothetical protein
MEILSLQSLRRCERHSLKKNHALIDSITNKVIEEAIHTNSDILTEGRQTFCPFISKSVTAAEAYQNMCDFLTRNGASKTMTTIEWIQSIMGMMEKESIDTTEHIQIITKTKIFDREEN